MVLSKQIKYLHSVSDSPHAHNQGMQGSSEWSQAPVLILVLENNEEWKGTIPQDEGCWENFLKCAFSNILPLPMNHKQNGNPEIASKYLGEVCGIFINRGL